MQTLHRQPLLRWHADKIVDQLGRVVEVKPAQPSDPMRVVVVLDPRLQRPTKCHHAHEFAPLVPVIGYETLGYRHMGIAVQRTIARGQQAVG